MGRVMSVCIEPPKAQGVSQSKDWEIIGVDAETVPIEFMGVTLRPVDEKAVARLIRAIKGKARIPGIEYREVIKTTIRKG
jgi:hypothetical protein